MSNPGANPVTTARCVAPGAFSFQLTFQLKRPPSEGGLFVSTTTTIRRYFVGVAFGRRVFESILGTCVAPSSALK